eukprot:12411123-Karenia_brevis.AAC.1
MVYGRARSHLKKWPPIMELTNPVTSVIVLALQYLSSLLHCTPAAIGRLRLIWGVTGCTSLSQWETRFPNQVKYVWRLIHLASSAILRRHAKYFGMPATLWSIGDLRRPAVKRREMAEELLALRECCRPHGLPKKLALRVCMNTLTSTLFAKMFTFSGWAMKTSIVGLEDLHGRNRRNAHDQMVWHVFASRFVAAEL